ncbi:MAG: hypothetical protein M1829_006294 [Trizodia sp. TS-e1964]|nr:MAG: hypothetical protein M1829_006294 [Trizodia sp. TS-e1964]
MTSSPLRQPLKMALIQLASGPNKAQNLTHTRNKVVEAAKAGAKLIVLPECFNSPYGIKYFKDNAEIIPKASDSSASESPTYALLKQLAKETSTYLVGGSIPELSLASSATAKGTTEEKEKLYNTSLAFDPSGSLIASHRKIHLFDIDIPGEIAFRESDALSAGEQITILDLPEYGKVGLAICYDVRFPELAMIAARRGCFALVYPAAFNTITGPRHWSLLARARAVDNQVWVAMCSPARVEKADYQAWGHSIVVDPDAKVMAEAAEGEETLYVEMRPERLAEVRRNIPVTAQRRFDIYPDVSMDVAEN